MWGDINILCQVSIPFLRGLRVRKIKFSLFCPQPKRLVEIALDEKWITDGRSNKCWQLKDKILFQSQLTHYSHFHFQNDSEFHVLQKFKSQIQKFNINSVSGSWKHFPFWYRTIYMSNKSWGVDGRGLGWYEVGMDPNWLGWIPTYHLSIPN